MYACESYRANLSSNLCRVKMNPKTQYALFKPYHINLDVAIMVRQQLRNLLHELAEMVTTLVSDINWKKN